MRPITFALLASAAAVFATEPPAPYTPVEATAQEFRCLGRTTELGELLLPKQITTAGAPLLAAPIRLFSEPDLFAGLKCETKVVKRAGDSAQWQTDGESVDLSIGVKLTADCDGFCWYEIQLKPKRPVTLRSLGLEIPRIAKTARYFHSANYTWSNISSGLAELGGKWSGPFLPYLWLGDEERGLAWCAQSDQGWQLRDPARAIAVETRGDIVWVRTNWLDREEVIAAPITFRFGLQSSPVKPVSIAWRAKARILHDIRFDSSQPGLDGRCELDTLRDGGVKTVVIHDSWTKYFGQMVPADADRFRELIAACHQRGMRLLVYVGYGIARTAPEMQGKHDAWSVMPLIPWDPKYKPEMRGFDATCPNSGWADWLVAGTEKLFADFDLDGLYFDGTTAAWICQNQAHGCGWKDAQGNVRTGYPMLAARKLMRRIADTVHRHKPGGMLDAHMSSNFTLPTLAFCDSVWNGEQFESHTVAEKFEVPLHAFRTEFMGYAHGLDAQFLCYEDRPFTFDESIALAWLHGVEVRPYPKSLAKVTPLWRAMDRFGVSDARWRPYWSSPVASADSEAVQISAWTKGDKTLLFVSHLKRQAATVHVRPDLEKLGLKDFKASDALTESPLAVKDGAIELVFGEMGWRMLEIASR
ncbi:MAG: glycoside hydrolase domain-containing protein [Tepidisphaeraceae bacterium]